MNPGSISEPRSEKYPSYGIINLDDGLIDVCLVEKIPFIKAARFAHLLFTKKIDRYIEIIKAEEVTIKRKNNKIINLDGEAIKIKKKLKVKVNHLSLNILTPK